MDDPRGQDFVLLLRGVNVGGKNVMPMAALRTCLESAGFAYVETYIQSGNAIARSREADPAALAQTVGAALQPLGYAEPVLVLPSADLRAVIAQAPVDFGSDPKVHRYDVLFPLDRARARSAVSEVPCNPVVDAIWAGDGALYYRRLISQASKSHLSRLVKLPLYKRLTIRNWATTTRLMAMLSARPS